MTLWISSFPRSGNTLLRQVLYAGWGLSSASVYSRDLGENLDLIRSCGHVDLRMVSGPQGGHLLNPHNLPIKTHERPSGSADEAIYIVRDGRAACVSLWHFKNRGRPLTDIVRGQSRFGNWSDHVMAWLAVPGLRAVIRYEDLIGDMARAVAALTPVFGTPAGDPAEPLLNRDQLAMREGTWVRPVSNWQEDWSDECEELFRYHNAPALAVLAGQAEAGAEPLRLSA